MDHRSVTLLIQTYTEEHARGTSQYMWSKKKLNKNKRRGGVVRRGYNDKIKCGTVKTLSLRIRWCFQGNEKSKPYWLVLRGERPQQSYHWLHIWLLLLFILIWFVSCVPILSLSHELYRETHEKGQSTTLCSRPRETKQKKILILKAMLKKNPSPD